MTSTENEWVEAAPEIAPRAIGYLRSTWNESVEEFSGAVDEDDVIDVLSSRTTEEALDKIDDLEKSRTRRRKLTCFQLT
jgi:hypothetical protein